MLSSFIYYTESNIICVIIFGIMLVHDLMSVDRQEKQIKYDHTLIAFMLYFISDSLWMAVTSEAIPKNTLNVVLVNFLNYVLMATVTYTWLRYVMAVELIANRNRRINKFAIVFPFLVSTVALVLTYIFAPQVLINESFEVQPVFNIYLIIVPHIYIIAVLFYAIKKALTELNPIEKRKHLYIGLFPLIVVVGGLIQLLLPDIPIHCFCCTILMLIFYIRSMEAQISVDPLTNLNNRGELIKYISQESGANKNGKAVFVIMMDINDFKTINDTYGHSEGDRALKIIADSLKSVMSNNSSPSFLARYGGDEFIVIIQLNRKEYIDELIDQIHRQIELECQSKNLPYLISIGIGSEEFKDKDDTMQKCIQRADRNLYINKENSKKSGITTVIR